MRDIAEGAGISLAAVGMLNARYENAFTFFGKDARSLDRAAGEASGCTTFGALPEATADGGTWIGQNWDWLAGTRAAPWSCGRKSLASRPSFSLPMPASSAARWRY